MLSPKPKWDISKLLKNRLKSKINTNAISQTSQKKDMGNLGLSTHFVE
jgi:hypothetical protein